MDADTVPAQLHLECGAVVAHVEGTRVFNYYDMKAGVIARTATYADPATAEVHDLDGGAWWVLVRHDDGSQTLLDQSRMCSIEFARGKGWLR